MDSQFEANEKSSHFRNADKVTFLSQCPLFSGLNRWELKSIVSLMRLVEYKKNEIIYRPGDEADRFFVVVSGRFEASTAQNQKKKVFAHFHRGDHFGEGSLLAGEPHSMIVQALSDGLILQLNKKDFKKIIESKAAVAVEISRRLTARLRRAEEGVAAPSKSDVISIFSIKPESGSTVFSINLATSLFKESNQKTILLDIYSASAHSKTRFPITQKVSISDLNEIKTLSVESLPKHIVKHPLGFELLSLGHRKGDLDSDEIITHLLNFLAANYSFIVIDLPNFIDEVVLKAFGQSDRAFFVTDSHVNSITETKDAIDEVQNEVAIPDDKISIALHEALLGIRSTTHTQKELFGFKNCYSIPSLTASQSEGSFDVKPFVVEQPDAEYSKVIQRIARRVSNNLVGLALGSGAALGLAHIGVLKVLEAEKIPIDMIAGSSIGALIGALFAVGKTPHEIERIAWTVNKRVLFGRMLDFHLFPIHGLLRGKGVMRHFKAHLSNKTFDDCRVPLKIMGVNLSARKTIVFESGSIADAVRASIAIPAIFDPVYRRGDVVVDGGILSPLPVSTLLEHGVSKIIAVDVLPATKEIIEKRVLLEEAKAQEEVLIRKQNMLKRALYQMRKFLARGFNTNVVDILMNTIQAMESEMAATEGQSADVLIRPVVSKSSWVEFYKPHQFIERGEEETRRLLPAVKELVFDSRQ